MQAIVSPSVLKGSVTVPASKSAMQRACAAALIRQGKTRLINPGISADDKAAVDIIQSLGASVAYENESILIQSMGIKPVSRIIHCGESGLSVRMFTSIAATTNVPLTITGTGSLLKRPLGFFQELFPGLGVYCTTENGLLPIKIRGPLKPASIEVDGSLSSQFLTGLLMAYSATHAKDVMITVNHLNSKPYIDLTMDVMKKFGLQVPVNDNYHSFFFTGESHFNTEDLSFYVESDWSGGAFLLVAGALAGDIKIFGLDINSTQGDKDILSALERSGVKYKTNDNSISISRSNINSFEFNATDCPDLFPPVVALASYAKGRSDIRGVNRLTHKESNRALSLQKEFGKMGVNIEIVDDVMHVYGRESINGAVTDSHHDHRIAMACGVAALHAGSPMEINGSEAVTKSYPGFWNDLKTLGANVILK